MRRLWWLVCFSLVIAGCTARGDVRPEASWTRQRFLRAHPTTDPPPSAVPWADGSDGPSAEPSPSPPATSATPSPTPSGTPTARTAVYGKRVGALFAHDTHGDHFCTASAVDSPGRNLIITAAHCIHGGKDSDYSDDLVFVPGYRDGKAPYGVWKVRTPLVDKRWADDSDPDLDVGFAVLEPLDGKNIEDVLGSNRLGVNEGFENVVRVTGYPMHSDEPITCTNTTTREDTYQMRFACRGYFPGTSGSPWLAHFDPATHTGEVVGVIGGYHEGGNVDTVSYSSYFDDDVKHLYDQAVSAGTAS